MGTDETGEGLGRRQGNRRCSNQQYLTATTNFSGALTQGAVQVGEEAGRFCWREGQRWLQGCRDEADKQWKPMGLEPVTAGQGDREADGLGGCSPSFGDVGGPVC